MAPAYFMPLFTQVRGRFFLGNQDFRWTAFSEDRHRLSLAVTLSDYESGQCVSWRSLLLTLS